MKEDFSKYNSESTILRKAQMRMLEILIEVDKICKKYDIPYWLDGGTLLGAMRHGGFIPWDDDLDIAMLRKDYDKLRIILPKELPAKFVFEDWKTNKNFTMKHAKVRDTNSYYEDPDWHGKDCLHGIYIDIFPKEKAISNKWRKRIDFFYGRVFRRLHGFNESRNEFCIACLMWLPSYCIASISQCFSNLFGKNNLGQPFGGITLYHICKKSTIFPLKEMLFENHTFPVPNDAHQYLTYQYGNYMQIPPEEKRKMHATKIDIW
jgi:lipopolysaccharide cholinephosphotransferase